MSHLASPRSLVTSFPDEFYERASEASLRLAANVIFICAFDDFFKKKKKKKNIRK